MARTLRPDIRIIIQKGRGKGAALRQGITEAAGDIIVTLDADGSTDPVEIPSFVGALLAGADFAKGSRFIQGGGTADMPLYRMIGNWGLVILVDLLFGVHFTDITYGYNAFWRNHRDSLALEIDGWASEIVSNIRVARRKLRVTEVASFEYSRVVGSGKLSAFSAGWVILKAILRERFTPTCAELVDIKSSGNESFSSAIQVLLAEAVHLARSRERLSPLAYTCAQESIKSAFEIFLKTDTDEKGRLLQRRYQKHYSAAKFWTFLEPQHK